MPKWGRSLMDLKLLQLGSDYYFSLKKKKKLQDRSKKAVEAEGRFHICRHVGRIKLRGFS